MRRLVRVVAAVLVVVLFLGSCSTSGSDTYEIVARFSRAVAVYEQSDVKVMGVTVGQVRDIEIDGDEIVVTLSIRDDVPLPADATVAIAPVSLIGERDIVLPAWTPGQERMEPGTVIGVDRTIIPVEPDEALQAITDLVEALDPASVNELLTATSGALAGKGATINEALLQLSRLIPAMADQDEDLLSIADDVDRLAAVARAREAEIGRLLDDFATVAGVLDEERQQIVDFVDAMVRLAREGKALLTAYEVTLPEDLDAVATLALTIKVNAGAVQQLVDELFSLNVEIVDAYDGQHMAIRGRGPIDRTILEQLLPILDELGADVPCLPTYSSTCG
ncbi:MCE family protein [Actinospongicola halichondriae]|uniref:MCE family protein n=1 Tax=Actinospongicola halichondriae TaxID=3236844 RepID=UPI003D469463